MNLQEYTGQSDRCSIGEVVLTGGQYKVLCKAQGLILINVILFDISYVKKSDSNILWTMDEHGNPKSRSVFSVSGIIQ